LRKIYLKLAASFLSVITAITMIVGASYAWLTLSESPAVNGINVSIGGGNTILLAPDLTAVTKDEYGNEITVHYPGAFDETLNLSQYDTYNYLKKLEPLSPVSTADGIHWILPVYEEETGRLLDISEFQVDSTLTSNSFAYLDFWVVSPGTEYNLRVATDPKTNEGSFLMELPSVEKDSEGRFVLTQNTNHVSSIARVGFLANSDNTGSKAMEVYSRSDDYDERFKSLSGVYQERGELWNAGYATHFSIYEPNALQHPQLNDQEGKYLKTQALGYDFDTFTINETDISNIVAAQKNSSWRMRDGEIWLQDILDAAVAGKADLTEEAAGEELYQHYLSGQIAAYVQAGNFLDINSDIEEQLQEGSGAVEEVMITTLQRNVPQRIRMFIWLEGQDADCINTSSVPESSFSVGIKLAGETT